MIYVCDTDIRHVNECHLDDPLHVSQSLRVILKSRNLFPDAHKVVICPPYDVLLTAADTDTVDDEFL